MMVAFDTETTGVEPGSRLLEIAMIAFDEESGDIRDTIELMVNPGMPVPACATDVHNITDELFRHAERADVVLKKIMDWMPSRIVVGHNACFDTGIINWELGRAGITPPDWMVHCTCTVAREMNETKNNKLESLVKKHGLKSTGDMHRALNDADLCRQLFMTYKKRGVPMSPLPFTHAGHDYRYPDQLPDALRELPAYIETGRRFRFEYTDAQGRNTEREITPYGYALVESKAGENIMLHGWCHLRNDRRTFRGDRVRHVPEINGTGADTIDDDEIIV